MSNLVNIWLTKSLTDVVHEMTDVPLADKDDYRMLSYKGKTLAAEKGAVQMEFLPQAMVGTYLAKILTVILTMGMDILTMTTVKHYI